MSRTTQGQRSSVGYTGPAHSVQSRGHPRLGKGEVVGIATLVRGLEEARSARTANENRLAELASMLGECPVRTALGVVHRVESNDPLAKLAAVICATAPSHHTMVLQATRKQL